MGHTEEAIKYFEKDLELTKELNIANPQNVALILFSMAHLQLSIKQFENAESNYSESLKYYLELAKENHEEYHDLVAKNYISLSWVQLFEKKFKYSEATCLKGLETDNTQLWIKVNLGHALLFQGKFEEAKEIYMNLKDEQYSQDKTKTFKEIFLKDLADLEQDGITHPDVVKICELLNQ